MAADGLIMPLVVLEDLFLVPGSEKSPTGLDAEA